MWLYCGFIRLCAEKNDFNKLYKTIGELGSDGTNEWLGEGQCAECFKVHAMARDGDGRGRGLVDMRVR